MAVRVCACPLLCLPRTRGVCLLGRGKGEGGGTRVPCSSHSSSAKRGSSLQLVRRRVPLSLTVERAGAEVSLQVHPGSAVLSPHPCGRDDDGGRSCCSWSCCSFCWLSGCCCWCRCCRSSFCCCSSFASSFTSSFSFVVSFPLTFSVREGGVSLAPRRRSLLLPPPVPPQRSCRAGQLHAGSIRTRGGAPRRRTGCGRRRTRWTSSARRGTATGPGVRETERSSWVPRLTW